MDYKIIALDIDGTLTNSQKEITPRTRYAIIDAQKMGKKVVIASGRHPMGIQSIARDLLLDRYEGYIMAFNGGKILDCTTGQTIVSKDFPKEYLSDILGVLKESNLSVHTLSLIHIKQTVIAFCKNFVIFINFGRFARK